MKKALVTGVTGQDGAYLSKIKGKRFRKEVPNLVFRTNTRKKHQGKAGNQRRDGIKQIRNFLV